MGGTAENAGIGTREYASMRTDSIQATSQLALLALTNITYQKSILFPTLKQYTGSCTVTDRAHPWF